MKAKHLKNVQLKIAVMLDPENDYWLADLADASMELAKVTFLQAQGISSAKDSNPDLWSASRARRGIVNDSQVLLMEAITYFERANKINPTDHVCLGSWGLGLADLADIYVYTGNETKADECLREAMIKFEASCAIEPTDFLIDWARTLYERSKITDGDIPVQLLTESVEKFRYAMSLVRDILILI